MARQNKAKLASERNLPSGKKAKKNRLEPFMPKKIRTFRN